ncbi:MULTISPECIES: MFS transporter [unclassified Streptomyces]|uniref:MFS transporter n=1 Tax=unclassified Streptomyces TaxID=2593676 RepID=UPI00036DD644|nr:MULTISPECIES: MFS transporter [unclassified Streptomyces]MYT33166.1 MFS transporter [Streptomyces sp. SID8354]
MSGAAAEATEAATAPPERAAPHALHVRAFRRYLLGQLVSNTGTWMHRAAQDWLVLQLTGHSGTAVGIVTALQFLPQSLLGLWGGVIADRYPKRTLLLLTQSLMAGQALLLGTLTLGGTVRVWHVYVLATALGTATALDGPARNAFIGELVGRARLPSAVSVNAAQFNAARILGPAVAGLVIAALGSGWVFLLNAVSYAAVLAGLATMRPHGRAPAHRRAANAVRLTDALRHIRTTPPLRRTIALTAVIGTFCLNFQVTISLMATTEFHTGAAAFGALSAAYAAGSLLGALRAAGRSRPPSLRLLVGWAAAFGLLEAATGVMPTPVACAVMLVPTGVAAVLVTTMANTLVQLSTDPDMRGRVLSVYFLVLLGGTPLGAPLIGWIAQTFGARYGLVLGGSAGLLAAGAVAATCQASAHPKGEASRDPATAGLRDV